MRKIPLEVYYFAGSLRVMAQFLLQSENPHIFAPINAIVDTGSPMTLIGPVDLKKMRLSKIQLEKLEGKNRPVNIGGGQIFTRSLRSAKLKFGDFETDMPVEFPLGGEENPSQPSLLGVDFMLKTKPKLFFDPNKKEAYFEVE